MKINADRKQNEDDNNSGQRKNIAKYIRKTSVANHFIINGNTFKF